MIYILLCIRREKEIIIFVTMKKIYTILAIAALMMAGACKKAAGPTPDPSENPSENPSESPSAEPAVSEDPSASPQTPALAGLWKMTVSLDETTYFEVDPSLESAVLYSVASDATFATDATSYELEVTDKTLKMTAIERWSVSPFGELRKETLEKVESTPAGYTLDGDRLTWIIGEAEMPFKRSEDFIASPFNSPFGNAWLTDDDYVYAFLRDYAIVALPDGTKIIGTYDSVDAETIVFQAYCTVYLPSTSSQTTDISEEGGLGTIRYESDGKGGYALGHGDNPRSKAGKIELPLVLLYGAWEQAGGRCFTFFPDGTLSIEGKDTSELGYIGSFDWEYNEVYHNYLTVSFESSGALRYNSEYDMWLTDEEADVELNCDFQIEYRSPTSLVVSWPGAVSTQGDAWTLLNKK